MLATAFFAASSKSLAGVILRPLSNNIFLASSTLVPKGEDKYCLGNDWKLNSN